MRSLILISRCKNAYDIYLKKISSLSYAPDVYVVYRNGRKIEDAPSSFKTIKEAENYIKEVA